jgi:hypothetical protein
MPKFKFKGNIEFRDGTIITIDREFERNGDIPAAILEETLKVLIVEKPRREAVMEAALMLNYDESYVRKRLPQMGL